MAEKIKRFRDLRIWQESIQLVKSIYTVTNSFPNNERFGLASQLRRAAVSVPSNVAEGFRRRHRKEFRQFLCIVLGSLAELETQIVIARELNYLSIDIEENVIDRIDYIARMTATLINKI